MPGVHRVALLGASGRVGAAIEAVVAETAEFVVVPVIGRDAEAFADALAGCDVAIEFSRPAAAAQMAEICGALAVPLVSGTTGLTTAQLDVFAAAAQRTAICRAANFSIGVTALTEVLGPLVRAVGDGFDVEILEAHHRRKVDAPSGTALALGEAVAAARGIAFDAVARLSGSGANGARQAGTIGFAALRGGDTVGDHTVFLFGEGERIELRHLATSRRNFAAGALRAARWLIGRPAGLYQMRDVLGFSVAAAQGEPV